MRSLTIPSNVVVRATRNGWMTSSEYSVWLLQVYKREDHRRLLIIVDSYKPHKADSSVHMAKERCNADVVIIPGGCKSLIQPMGRCIHKPFKESMRSSWEEWMRQDRAKTAAGNLKQPTRQDAINWVSKAWSSITSDTLKRSFLVCGISNALDGTQDDMVSDDLPDIDASEVEIAQPDALEEEEDIDDVDPFSDDSDEDC